MVQVRSCSIFTLVENEYLDILSFFFLAVKEPLPWSTRVKIALDSARGLEYIHEHTVPVYIHRDIKSANILLDKNFRGKVSMLLVSCIHMIECEDHEMIESS